MSLSFLVSWLYVSEISRLVLYIEHTIMKIISSYDTRYRLMWTTTYAEIFYDGRFAGRFYASGLEEAKKIFEIVAQGKETLEDVIRFNEVAHGMIGVDLSVMSYSNDRQQILYKGNFFANA